MLELNIQDEYQAIVAGDFRLAFRWSGDRWSHELVCQRAGDSRVLVRSFYIAPEHEEPSRVISPAFQQLSLQEAGPSKALALLVGQSGPHHFSAVFAVEERPTLSLISVDLADRCRKPVEALACTYQVDAGVEDLADADDGSMTWAIGPRRLTLAAIHPARVGTAEAGRRGTTAQVLAGPSADGPTRRCLYTWTWITSP